MFNFYDWGLPNQAQHIATHADNEQVCNFVRSLWNSLDSVSTYFLATAVVVAVLAACCYYYVYNKLPGRKYRIRHWSIWLAGTAVVTIISTIALGNAIVSSPLPELKKFIIRMSLINGLYASVIYFIASFIICNLPVPTNAYRFLKLGK